jgi:hypothetical protein
VREAEYFARALVDRGLPLGAIVVNKVLPSYFSDKEAAALAERVKDRAGAVAEDLAAAHHLDASQVHRVLSEVADSFLNFGVVARREAELQAELATRPEVLVSVPFFETDVVDMASLLRLGSVLWD